MAMHEKLIRLANAARVDASLLPNHNHNDVPKDIQSKIDECDYMLKQVEGDSESTALFSGDKKELLAALAVYQ